MLCESCGFAAAIETVPDRRHRVPSTYRLCCDCAAEARGVLMPPAANHDLARALLSALQAEPLTRAALLLAVQAEPSEHRAAHGVITGLINRGMVTQTGGMLHLTDHGRHQLKPVPVLPSVTLPEIQVPPVTSPGKDAWQPGPLWTQAETAALSDLRAAVKRVGIQGRNLFVTCDLLVGAREAIEVTEQRKEKAEEARRSIIETAKDGEGMQEQLSREVSDLIRALRSIEAALPGGPSGLRADAIADRAIGLLHGCADGAREREALRQERDDSQREYAALDDVFEGEKTLHAETRAALAAAEAGITRLRADLEGAIAAEKATAEKLAEAESEIICLRVGGPYWTRQGDRHTMSILRPVEVAVLLVDPASVGWEAGQHSGRVVGSGPEALDLAQRLAEVAAGVRS